MKTGQDLVVWCLSPPTTDHIMMVIYRSHGTGNNIHTGQDILWPGAATPLWNGERAPAVPAVSSHVVPDMPHLI